MAYKGLAAMVYAPLTAEVGGVPVYGTGGVLGRAMKYELDPEYEDTADYEDLNDLDPRQEFVRAKLTLGAAETSDPALVMFGDTAEEGGLVSVDISTATPCGLGLVMPEVYRGRVTWVVLWLYKVFLQSIKESAESRTRDIAYMTPEISGMAVPAGNGRWKHKYKFESKDEALSFATGLASTTI